MASPNFEPGRPTENANELARLIERGLRETKAVDLEALCVLAGRKVRPAISIAITKVLHIDSPALHSTASSVHIRVSCPIFAGVINPRLTAHLQCCLSPNTIR